MEHPPTGVVAPDEPDEARLHAWERRTDMPLTVVASVFLVVYALQVLATRPGQTFWTVLEVTLWVIWVVFVVDYVVRVIRARRRLRFVITHPIDLLVVLAPFFRFLRLLRLVAAVTTLGRVLRDDFRGRVGTSLAVAVSLLSFVAALGVYEAERDAPESSITTFGDALWWVLTTITTVGYGDRYPITTEGRLVAAGLMLAGIAVLGTVTAGIASWFLERIGAEAATQAATAPPAPPAPGPGPSDWDAVLTELRLLRRRVDELENAPTTTPSRPDDR